ncbi:MAG: hypothetical protein Q7S22_03595 [Candidatus Micrarchaeota archaeon]|nr:hypothetical protein [Candidatus Micrarchaeota archaeon]
MAQNKEIREIKERNARVDTDKSWETSKTRRAIIGISIYLIAVFLFNLIKTPNPFLDALIPSLAFILSTLTLPFFKQWWLKTLYKK